MEYSTSFAKAVKVKSNKSIHWIRGGSGKWYDEYTYELKETHKIHGYANTIKLGHEGVKQFFFESSSYISNFRVALELSWASA